MIGGLKKQVVHVTIERQRKGKLKGGDTEIGRKISERMQQKKKHNLTERKTGVKTI